MPFFHTAVARACAACTVFATTISPTAHAQTADAPTGESAFDVGRVVVTAAQRGPLRSRSLLTSVDVVNADALAGQSVQATWELFNLVPGALLTNFNQGTTSGKVAMRGFNGEGNVNAVKMLIDGVPANSNDGNMPFLDAVMPLELQAIEVVRGTNDARYGLHNIAGNINLVTARGGNDLQARLGAGAFNSLDLQLAKGIESGAFSQNYFVGHKRSNGWRDHSDSHKTTLSGQWFYNGATWQAGLTARHFTHDAQEPGYLTDADAVARPRLSYAFSATDGGERTADQLALHLDGRLATALDGSVRVYRNRYVDQRWVQFSAGTSQQERDSDEVHTGMRATLSWRPPVAGMHAMALEGGVDFEHQDDRSQRYLTTQRLRQSQTRDQAWTLDTTGAYVQAVLQPTATVKIVPGWRVDRVSGDFSNQLAHTSAGINDYGHIHQPKLSAVWSPVVWASVYANWGRTFQVGVGSGSFKIPPRVADLRPSINDGWEAGFKFRPQPWLDGRFAVWQQTATDEVRRKLNDPNGDSDNVGATRRRGADLQLGFKPLPGLDGWVAMTLQKAVIVEPDPLAPATRGKEIDHVPHHLVNAGMDWRVAPTLKLSATLNGQSSYFLDSSNATGRYGAYALLNLGASWQASPSWTLDAQLRNATNRATAYVWHDGTQALHSPGAPRGLFVALSTRL